MERDLKKVVDEILIDEDTLKKRIKELAYQITEDYKGDERDLLLVGILKGASFFMTELALNLGLPVFIDYMSVTSYGKATESSGVVRVLKDIDHSLVGKNVLLVEDIIDTGQTLDYVKKTLENRKAESVKIASLLDKPSRRKTYLKADYVGFEVPNEFLIGFGLDYQGMYRNLPYIASLKREVYET